mgnify:CR=1 FL=1
MFKTMIVKSIGGGYCPRYTLVILDRPQGGGDTLRWLGDATAATEDPNHVGNPSDVTVMTAPDGTLMVNIPSRSVISPP